MTALPPAPPPGGGDGYRVVAEKLKNLPTVFEKLEDAADGFEQTVDEHTSISGEQTGPKCCPEAGDALRTGLQHVVSNIQAFATHALDIRGAVQATVRNYENADQAGADRMNTTGGAL